jgi:hypothetical protein
MKKPWLIVLGIAMAAICIGLTVAAYFFYKKNPISQANRLKSKARQEYFRREYVNAYTTYKLLVDSLGIQHDAANLNYANAAFMSSNILLNGFYGRNNNDKEMAGDSMLQFLADFSRQKYQTLAISPDNKISSMASNQFGYSLIKGNKQLASTETDTTLLQALDHFKNSLRRDPQNDSARHNYELIKKIIDYPETVLAETKSLIAQKRYREAEALLTRAMNRDFRLLKQRDFLNRLRTVIVIDSLGGKGI